ncbi:nucleoside-diphosphate sugar epimerase/dehydratase [Modicisalibacter xianhensis]|uniref:Uncharacterized protein n=1 Tax=Modicisalibacter xianhensis TaxID=442341 RepID=A0A1I3C8N2_9GAMM|nr:hypothetical protein [Halomonas xianhensis]SFH70904.1 hypothetical protein SAMN04487959_10872 [Halomonas xianhensis]
MAPWLHRVGKRESRKRQPVILCGLNYEHYRIQSLIKRSKRYELLALIDDFPWNHGTLIDGVRVYYPSEALSLAKRHGVVRVLYHADGDLAVFDDDTLLALDAQGVVCSKIDPHYIDDLDSYLAGQA